MPSSISMVGVPFPLLQPVSLTASNPSALSARTFRCLHKRLEILYLKSIEMFKEPGTELNVGAECPIEWYVVKHQIVGIAGRLSVRYRYVTLS